MLVAGEVPWEHDETSHDAFLIGYEDADGGGVMGVNVLNRNGPGAIINHLRSHGFVVKWMVPIPKFLKEEQ